jgi:hypothetical protein
MSRKVLIPLLAAVIFAAPALTATAATTVHGTKSQHDFKVRSGKPKAARATAVHGTKSNADNKVGSGKPRRAAWATTVHGSKSNSSYRQGSPKGGGKGASGPANATTVHGTKSNQSERMGGGGRVSGGQGIDLPGRR